jgi:hypothetical protein
METGIYNKHEKGMYPGMGDGTVHNYIDNDDE